VGAGTNCAGTSIVYKAISPETRVIAVQSANAPSVYLSWKSGRLESTSTAKTMADGLATRQAFELPVKIIKELIDDFQLVSDEQIMQAVKLYVEKAHTIAEGAGAAPLAAAIKMKEKIKGKKVGLILSGGNITFTDLMKCLTL
jgi:threonine dehydratase